MELISDILTAAPTWVQALIGLFVAAKAITIITPTRHDNEIVDKILLVLNFLALNVFKDKNADAEKA